MQKMLTEGEAAPILGLAASTMQKMRVYGTGPRFHKLGRSVRYSSADLEEWLAKHRVSSTSEQVAA